MSENDQAQERTEQPSPRRLEKARSEGQVARSRELNTVSVLLAGGSSYLLFGGWAIGGIERILRNGLSSGLRGDLDPIATMNLIQGGIGAALGTLAPVMIGATIAALAGPLLLGGFTFSFEAFRPKLSRLSPLQGFKRIISVQGLMELFKTVLKFSVLVGLAVMLLWSLTGEILTLGLGSTVDSIGDTGGIVRRAFIVIACGLLLIAAIDVPFVLWSHTKRLRMTRQEVRDEQKETEGSPETRARLSRVRQEIAGRRMMQMLPLADVVLTNPVHYAVALRYTDKPERAPRVIAKGRGLIAGRIREVAAEHEIPICESPLLTRAIYFNTELEKEIPAGLYLAVARVLVWVMNVKTAKQHYRPLPEFPTDLPVPAGLKTEPGFET